MCQVFLTLLKVSCCCCSWQEDIDLKALGFDVAEGVKRALFAGGLMAVVTKVDKGSMAEVAAYGKRQDPGSGGRGNFL